MWKIIQLHLGKAQNTTYIARVAHSKKRPPNLPPNCKGKSNMHQAQTKSHHHKTYPSVDRSTQRDTREKKKAMNCKRGLAVPMHRWPTPLALYEGILSPLRSWPQGRIIQQCMLFANMTCKVAWMALLSCRPVLCGLMSPPTHLRRSHWS